MRISRRRFFGLPLVAVSLPSVAALLPKAPVHSAVVTSFAAPAGEKFVAILHPGLAEQARFLGMKEGEDFVLARRVSEGVGGAIGEGVGGGRLS